MTQGLLEDYRLQAFMTVGGRARHRWMELRDVTPIERVPFKERSELPRYPESGLNYRDEQRDVIMERYTWDSPDGKYHWVGYIGYHKQKNLLYVSCKEVLDEHLRGSANATEHATAKTTQGLPETYLLQALMTIGGSAVTRWVLLSLSTPIVRIPYVDSPAFLPGKPGKPRYVDNERGLVMSKYEWASKDGRYTWHGFMGYQQEKDVLYVSFREDLAAG
jgi:hypothetical protein